MKRSLSQEFIRKVISCAYNSMNKSEMAAALGISRRWLYELMKRPAVQNAIEIGKRRRSRQFWRSCGECPDAIEAEFSELEERFQQIIDTDDPFLGIEAEAGYEITRTEEVMADGSIKITVKKEHKPANVSELIDQLGGIYRRKGRSKGCKEF